MKTCPACKSTKPFKEFYKDKSQPKGIDTYCKACSTTKRNSKKHNLKKFGISIEEYNQMFNEQEGKCAICDKHQSEEYRALNVDHNHTTGQIRGLLCNNCNTGLGRFFDNVDSLQKAIHYLERAS